MKQIRINKAEFDELRSLQTKKHPGCHASFSTNPSEEKWPFSTYGLTPLQVRDEVRNLSPVLDDVIGLFLQERPRGGRFFFDVKGAYWKDANSKQYRFIEWLPEEPLQTMPGEITYAELLAEVARNRSKKV